MSIQSFLKFGNLAVNMLGTPQFRNMAKFIVPYLTPASPGPEGGSPSQNPTGQAKSTPAPSPQQPYAGYPGWLGYPTAGMPGSMMHPQSHPRLGGLEALRGFMGHGAPQAPSAMGSATTNPLAGVPFRKFFQYATPQNVQKLMEWQKVMKEFSGLLGAGSAPAGAAAAQTTQASGIKQAKAARSKRGTARTVKHAVDSKSKSGVQQRNATKRKTQ